jgi:hypothetical protein
MAECQVAMRQNAGKACHFRVQPLKPLVAHVEFGRPDPFRLTSTPSGFKIVNLFVKQSDEEERAMERFV